jgi:PAS domain S-box-containing protein
MDIPDRKAAEQKLQEATERFRLIVDNALDYAIFTFDLAGRFTSWNPGAEQILLYKAEEVLGRDCRILWTAADRVARAPETEMNRALTEGRAEDNRWHVRKGGTQFFAAGVVVPLRNATGEVSGFLKIMRDETERKHAEEELTRYRERLEELVVERTQALRLSLMNLRRSERLASILMLAEYARQNPADTSHNETYRMIIEQTIRCSTIVKGILQFARDEKTPKAPNQINPVLVRACELAKTYVHGEGLWIDLDLADNLPPVVMNTTEIEQVIVNLIKNAAQAAASLGGEVRVVVRSTLQDDHVRISVEDNGPGIDPQYLPQIFDPFFSTTRHAGGTGLGLSITHGIVTEHGGEITVESELGRGTTFLVYLPVHAPSAGTPEPVEAPAPT